MRVFVAGATGVVGRPLLRRLVARGHEVSGMTRSPEKAELVRAEGATPVVCDALDAEATHAAVVAARPDVVVHQLTQIPRALHPRRYDAQFALTDRLRSEATRTLVEAALAARARRVVAQSVAFAYAPAGGPVKSERDPLYLDAPAEFRGRVEAIVELERTVLETGGIDGTVLRYGYVYGPGTAFAPDGHTAELVRRRRFPIVGGGTGIWSFVHVEDAAEAAAVAVDAGRGGLFNIVDDEPAPVREWLPEYAAALGAKPPRRVPRLVGRLAAGRYTAELMTKARGASNAEAKRVLGWRPCYASWREGFASGLG